MGFVRQSEKILQHKGREVRWKSVWREIGAFSWRAACDTEHWSVGQIACLACHCFTPLFHLTSFTWYRLCWRWRLFRHFYHALFSKEVFEPQSSLINWIVKRFWTHLTVSVAKLRLLTMIAHLKTLFFLLSLALGWGQRRQSHDAARDAGTRESTTGQRQHHGHHVLDQKTGWNTVGISQDHGRRTRCLDPAYGGDLRE